VGTQNHCKGGKNRKGVSEKGLKGTYTQKVTALGGGLGVAAISIRVRGGVNGGKKNCWTFGAKKSSALGGLKGV